MALIIAGNSEIGVHVRCNLCYLICLMHWIRSREVTNLIILSENGPFAFMRVHHVLRYHLFNKRLVYTGIGKLQIIPGDSKLPS